MSNPSHLTRAVFRAITNNRPIFTAGCRLPPQRTSQGTRISRLSYTSRKGRMFGAIFGTLDRGFEGAKNTPRNMELALGRLVDLVRARRSQSRGPVDEEVLDAFKFLFVSRLEGQRRLTRNEVYLATEVFKHLEERGLVMGRADGPSLGAKDLNNILKTLALPSAHEKFRSDARYLANRVFAALKATHQESDSVQDPEDLNVAMPIFAIILARTGSALDALKLLEQSINQNIEPDLILWVEILKGLASEGRHKDFQYAMQAMRHWSKNLSASDYEELILFLSENNNFNEAKRVYEDQVTNSTAPTTKQLQALLELCIRKQEFTYGLPISQALEERIGEDGVLGSLFMWVATSSQDIHSIPEKMERLAQIAPRTVLSMTPFNSLIALAYKLAKPDLATVAIKVAHSFGFQSDGKHVALQLQYAIDRSDMVAATELFEELTRQDIPNDNSDIEVLNNYVTVLSCSAQSDYNSLMRAIDYLLERNADFTAESLAGVCRVFLQRDELEDLTGLLRHRVDFYPGADRARISAVFQEFISDPSLQDQRAYNIYELFRTAFPETPVAQRIPLMQSFFNRKRPDLACLVFGHMRQREDPEARPDSNAYARCFAGIAQCRDVDGLQMVYNMLKMDLEVELTTKVRNSLMLAYVACQMPYTAMIDHFWKIMDSQEGPTYSTFEIALRACESWIPQGGYEARKIMAIVQAWNLEVTKDLYDGYIGAIAGQSEFENTIELIEEMEDEIGDHPDAFTIGTFYNAIPWQYRKDAVEKWARKAYPDLWEDLETYGDEIDEEWEIRYFKIDRSIDIEDPLLFTEGQYDPRISRTAVQALEPPAEGSRPVEDLL